jgi:hypothetical protein
MRVLGALACAAFLASAFVSARRLGTWAVLGVAATIVPTVLYFGAIVNPSGLEIASAVCLWATVAAIALVPRLSTRLIVRAAIAFIVFANCRGLSLPMAVLALTAPLCLASRARLRELAGNRVARASGIVMAVGTCVAVLWILLFGRYRRSPFAQFDFTVLDGMRRTWKVFGEGIASFGYLEVRDVVAILVSTALWGLLLLVSLRAGRRRDRVVVVTVVTIAVTVPIVVSVLNPPPVYTYWQGRHGLPLWVGVPILAGAVASTGRQLRTPSRAVVIGVACLIGAEQISAFATAARRYTVGTRGPVLYILNPRWTGPVPPALLLALMVIASAFLVARISRCALPGDSGRVVCGGVVVRE